LAKSSLKKAVFCKFFWSTLMQRWISFASLDHSSSPLAHARYAHENSTANPRRVTLSGSHGLSFAFVSRQKPTGLASDLA
jgi:acetate kinase